MPTYMNPDGTVSLLDPRRKSPIVLPPNAAPLLQRDLTDIPVNPYGVGPDVPSLPIEPASPEGVYVPRDAATGMTGEELDMLDRLAAKYPEPIAPQPVPNDFNLISQEGGGGTTGQSSGATATAGTSTPAPASDPDAYTPGPGDPKFVDQRPNQMSLTSGDEGKAPPTSGTSSPPSGPGNGPVSPVTGDALRRLDREAWEREQKKAGVYTPPSPAKWVPTQRSVKVGLKPLSPDVSGGLYGAWEEAGDSARRGGDYVGMLADELALRQAKASDQARVQLAELRTRQADQERELGYKMASIDRRIYEIRSMADENPVERYWARKGGLGTFMTKLGVAFGDLGSAVTGQPNRVYQQVRDEIEDEVNFQKAKIAHAQNDIVNQRGALADMRQVMLSPDAAEAAARALMFEAAAGEVRAYSSLMQGEQARQAGIQVADQLTLEAAKYRANSQTAEQDQIAMSEKFKPATAGGYGRPADEQAFIIKQAARWGIHPLQYAEWHKAGNLPVMKGQLDEGNARLKINALERQVAIPETIRRRLNLPYTELYATSPEGKTGSHVSAEILQDIGQYIDNIEELQRLQAKGNLESLKWAERERIKTISKWNALLGAKKVAGEALTQGEKDTWNALAAGGAYEFFTTDRATVANLQANKEQAIDYVKKRVGGLYVSPEAQPGTSMSSQVEASEKAKKKE